MSFKDKVKVLFSDIWNFIGPFVKLFLTQEGQIILSVASQAVIAIASDNKDASGADKQKAAFEQIKVQLISQSIAASVSTINAAIEVGVQRLKR